MEDHGDSHWDPSRSNANLGPFDGDQAYPSTNVGQPDGNQAQPNTAAGPSDEAQVRPSRHASPPKGNRTALAKVLLPIVTLLFAPSALSECPEPPEDAESALVTITAELAGGGGQRTGLGFFYAPGYVATAYHNIAGARTESIKVVDAQGRPRGRPAVGSHGQEHVLAKVGLYNRWLDLAVLEVAPLNHDRWIEPIEAPPDLQACTGKVFFAPPGGDADGIQAWPTQKAPVHSKAFKVKGEALLSADFRLIKFTASAPVVHGMSGGPLILGKGAVGVVVSRQTNNQGIVWAVLSEYLTSGLEPAVQSAVLPESELLRPEYRRMAAHAESGLTTLSDNLMGINQDPPGGLRVEVGFDDRPAVLCSGEAHPLFVETNRPARVRVYGVDDEGRITLGWEEPAALEGRRPLAPTAIPLHHGESAFRLVAVALPAGGSFGDKAPSQQRCRTKAGNGLHADLFPPGSAFRSTTHHVFLPGEAGCPGDPARMARHNRLLENAEKVPMCESRP